MKKLLLGALLVILLASCDHSFNEQKVNDKSSVPVYYSDSTRWEKAKVLIVSEDVMYVKTDKDTYRITSVDNTFAFSTFLLIVLLLVFVMAAAV
jgi:uncharacterized lipoprotein